MIEQLLKTYQLFFLSIGYDNGLWKWSFGWHNNSYSGSDAFINQAEALKYIEEQIKVAHSNQ